MKKIYPALSILKPNGMKIAQGIKTLEIRAWKPEYLPLKDLLIVENNRYLTQKEDEDIGQAIALVDIESVHAWRIDEFEAACASYWADGYWAWVICNVRPISQPFSMIAKRKIYFIELDHL